MARIRLLEVVVVLGALAVGCKKYSPVAVEECGNSLVEGFETCDGTDLSGETCQTQGFQGGTLLCNATCTAFDTSGCNGGQCGNDTIEGTEVCDGNDLGDETCQSRGFDGGTLLCNAGCDGFDTSGCTGPGCGNGTVDTGEVCDGADLGGETCLSQGFGGGTLACNTDCDGYDTSGCDPCGNAVVDTGETCDGTNLSGQTCISQGFGGGTLLCNATCDGFDTSNCDPCGNNVIDTGETCDGSALSGQNCITQGFDEGTLLCNATCDGYDTSGCVENCGNGAIDANEACDGTNLGGETCQSLNFDAGTLGCAGDCSAFDTSGCRNYGCGDDIQDPGELCDGADLAGYDCATFNFTGGSLACETNCLGFDVSGCTGPGCGNNTIDATEVCDGADMGGETCYTRGFDLGGTLGCTMFCAAFDTSGCRASTCGDQVAEGNETCDGTDLQSQDCVSIGQNFIGGTLRCAANCDSWDVTACIPDPVGGETCAEAGVIPPSLLPLTIHGDTTVAANDYSTQPGDCPGLDQQTGAMSGDVAYSFTPAVSAVYIFTLEGDFESALYLVSDCNDIPGTCLGGDRQSRPEQVHAFLIAGLTYYVIVDGAYNFSNESGSYSLTVSAPCYPDCSGKQCGDDGCAGSCGTCASPDVCNNATGQCVPPAQLPGNTCSNPHTVTTPPFSHGDDTVLMSNEYAFSTGACPGVSGGYGAGSNDSVYEFTPAAGGIYTITVVPDYDALLYVVTDCTDIDNTCLGASDAIGVAPERLSLDLSAGTTYFVIVDGWSNTNNTAGQYTIDIDGPCVPDCTNRQCGDDGCGGSCGVCTAPEVCNQTTGQCVDPTQISGNTCADPFTVTTPPYSDSGDTSLFSNEYSAEAGDCPGLTSQTGAGSSDVVYAFTPTAFGVYIITLDATAFEAALYVVTNCSDVAGTCLEGDRQSDPEQVSVLMIPGITYYIIVDGAFNFSNAAGPYTLNVTGPCIPNCTGRQCGSDGCGGSCGSCTAPALCDEPSGQCVDPLGNSCNNPYTVDPANLPYSNADDTSTAGNGYFTNSGECAGLGAAGSASNDQVYRFSPTVTGSYAITVDSTFDAVIYVVTDCSDIANTCQGGIDIAAGAGVEQLVVPMTQGTTYYIIVDGWSNTYNQAGAYTIDISQPCIPQCSGRVCGDDGCGSVCGTCTPPDLCDEGTGQCYNPAGNTCANAFTAGSTPYTDSGDTTISTNDYSADAGQCPGLAIQTGAGSNDVVYAFSPPANGVYTIVLDAPSFLSAVYVVTDCSDIANTCLGGAREGNPEVVNINMAAGSTYYIIVDGAYNFSNLYGPYTLDISGPCTPNCSGRVCGDDGCGGVCGTCTAPQLCDDPTGQCVPPQNVEGNMCVNPFVVSSTPYNDAGDTSDAGNEYSASAGACPGLSWGVGGASNDEVYSFQPSVSGSYTITVTPDFDAALYLVTDCADINNTCLGGSDAASPPTAPEQITAGLTAGMTYYIIVDGWSNSSNLNGPYTIDVIGPL